MNASRARWKLVALHHPPFTAPGHGRLIGGARRDREPGLEAQLGPLLRRHGVDAVIAGRDRLYARIRPRDGIRYFVTGGGGREPLADYDPRARELAAAGKFHHLLLLRATEERLEYYAIDDAGRSRDAGWFAKGSAEDTALPAGALPPP
jgi:hypothetical protein